MLKQLYVLTWLEIGTPIELIQVVIIDLGRTPLNISTPIRKVRLIRPRYRASHTAGFNRTSSIVHRPPQ
jgi:hypothetical protein